MIHPGQIQTVNDAFMPSHEKIEWAEKLVEEFEQHEISGKVRNTKQTYINFQLTKSSALVINSQKKDSLG